MQTRSTKRSIKNKLILIAAIVALVIFAAISFIHQYKKENSPVYRKLQGYYEIVPESLFISREKSVMLFTINLKINKDDIWLPAFEDSSSRDIDHIDNERINKWSDNNIGTWHVISENPDSISIKADKNTLDGRYAVTFIKGNTRNPGYFVLLDNDSTHLCLKKEVVNYGDPQYW